MLSKRLLLGIRTGEELTISGTNGWFSSSGDSCTSGLAFGSVSVSGGTSPYTYVWSKIGGSGSIATGQGSDTMGAAQFLCPGDELTGIFRCTVTDSAFNTVFLDLSYTWVLVGDEELIPEEPFPIDPEIEPEPEEEEI
jgi:hypothetical protein